MNLWLYCALILAQAGTSAKQFAMKHCGRLAPGAFHSVCINMARSVICLVVSVVIWLAAGGGATTLQGHLIIVIAGIGTAFNLFTWILSSRLVSLTLLESVSMIGSLIIPLILAPYLYDGDTVSPLQWIGCLLIFLSVFLFINKENSEKKEGSALQKILVVIICTVSIMVASVFKKYYTYHITARGLGSIEYFTFINFVTVLVVFLVLFVILNGVLPRSVRSENSRTWDSLTKRYGGTSLSPRQRSTSTSCSPPMRHSFLLLYIPPFPKDLRWDAPSSWTSLSSATR